jgi:hypothetical protein
MVDQRGRRQVAALLADDAQRMIRKVRQSRPSPRRAVEPVISLRTR